MMNKINNDKEMRTRPDDSFQWQKNKFQVFTLFMYRGKKT